MRRGRLKGRRTSGEITRDVLAALFNAAVVAGIVAFAVYQIGNTP